ncbi:hypothetical protein [uncultured Aquimarina sp.]|uniref:hypothetical protein n=1 Tax=uncultured Aquimarina sp. TaxID=575652 RepID=UPI002635CFD9|nr:hypothetical protein [uncultured Aquimarina sp.]
MDKIKKSILSICLLLLFLGCSDRNNSSISNKSKVLNSDSEIESSIVENKIPAKKKTQKQTSVSDLQGIWKGKKDLNQSIPYRIQNNKKILDILCIEGICDESGNDNSVLELSYLGFLDKDIEEILKNKKSYDSNSLLNEGKVMVRLRKNDIIVDENYSFDSLFYTTKLTSSYMYDEELYNRSSFLRIDALPKEIFTKLKNRSKVDNVNYIKQFNIQEQSKKVKVTANKTFFYTEMSEASKRKAFLVKNDIAYLEDINDDWVKVYYDGKIVSGGYIKRSNVEVLE